MISVVMAPILLHAASQELSLSTDEHMFATAALLLMIASLSVIGCVLEETCQCPRNFPLLVLVAQISTLVLAVVIWPSLFGTTLPKPNEVEEWLSKRWQNVLRARGIAGPVVATQAVQAPGNVEADVASANLRGAVETPEPSTPLPAPVGWLSAGEGYCEDGKSHLEFNSLHAIGKTLQECADVAMSDPESVALDFSTADGGCDIRFPAGSLFQSVPGFDWWGWGAGESAPRGSGTRKHDSATHCFVPQQRAPPTRPVREVSAALHPNYKALIQEYPFQPVRNERGDFVNIILVRSPFRTKRQEKLFQQFKNEILFMGISSWEDFPLPAPNPFSESFAKDKFVGLFPGFLYMHREPEKLFPSHVKLLLLSQSDFALPGPAQAVPKKYDFTFSGSDQDVDQDCVGWSSFAKNWTFAKEALEVMCGERMTGVLVATKNKPGTKACSIPASCKGLITQTTFLSQDEFFAYVKQSRFLFLPQVHDASPRVITQALALDVPLLMNRNLIGGWKYLTETTGEFFSDATDIKQSAQRLLTKAAGGEYSPRRYVDENAGDQISGSRLREFVETNFPERVKLPQGTRLLFPSGA